MKSTIYSALIALFIFTNFANAAKPAKEMKISPDGKVMSIGSNDASGFYDINSLPSIYLTFPQNNYWNLLTSNYQSKTDLAASMQIGEQTFDTVGVRFKGQTSYSNVKTQKKSFNISLDFKKDYEYEGYKTFNLNNSYEDASNMREVYYLNQAKKYIPAAKSNFVRLYINGEYWGIYVNVQQLNKDFYKEWFMTNDGTNWRADAPSTGFPGPGGGVKWGDGTAALNYLGEDTALYQKYYTMKSSDQANPWELLKNTTKILNQSTTNTLISELPKVLDIDRTLWHLATEIAFSDDDSYIYKGKMDYYLYYEVETGRITPIEYDGNSSLYLNGINWSAFYNETKVNYPLLNKMLAVPEWRQRYLAHLRTIIENSFNADSSKQVFDKYMSLIDTAIQNDPKKLATYTNFNNEVTKIRNFMNTRRTNLLANPELSQIAPVITNAAFFNSENIESAAPNDKEAVTVRANVASSQGIGNVYLYYASGYVGNFTKVEMFDDGKHNDAQSNDGIFAANIPPYSAGSIVRYYVSASSANASGSMSFEPKGAEHSVFVYTVKSSGLSGTKYGVVINEFVASNSAGKTDEAGENDDWIELLNTTEYEVDLSGWYITDDISKKTKFQFANGTKIPALGYLIVWADENKSQGSLHANFKLSASGEEIYLFSADTSYAQDEIVYDALETDVAWARNPNGVGNFVKQTPTFGKNNEDISSVEVNAATVFNMYPNPASNVLNIEISSDNFNNDDKIYISNSLGETMQIIEAKNQVIDIDNNIPSGIYFVKYGNSIQKLIISK